MAASLPIPDHLGIGGAYPSGCGFPVSRPRIATDGSRSPDKQHPVEMTTLRNGYLFDDRRDAGRALAARLRELDLDAPVIVALPRGGVPVGYEVAQQLGAPLDVGLVRKLGAPQQPELGIGAIGEDGTVVIDPGALALVPGAGHLFEEPGALEQVARLAGGWFLRHLAPAREPYATGL